MELVHMNHVLQQILKYVMIMVFVYQINKFVNANKIGLIQNVIKVNTNVTNKDVKEKVLVMLMELVVVIMDQQEQTVQCVTVLNF